MKEFKSVQDLIIKAALYDGVSTTIGPYELSNQDELLKRNAIKITFSRGKRYSATRIDLTDTYRDPEEVALYCCKRALIDLLCAPYAEIEIDKENHLC